MVSGKWKVGSIMMKTLLVAATMATLITGSQSRAQTITLDASSGIGRQALCRAEWKKQTDPQVREYGSAYFLKVCNRKLKAIVEAKGMKLEQPSRQ